MDQWLNTLNLWLTQNPGWISVAVMATALLESLAIVGLVVPGVAMLFIIAVVAGNHDLSVWVIMGWGCVGAILGDSLSYWFGRRFHYRISDFWPFRRHPATLQRGEAFFAKHGGKSIVLGRFIGPLRPVIPMVVGAFGMSARRFLGFNILSAVGWAPLYLLPGYLVGASLAQEPDLPPHFYKILAAGLLALSAGLALFFRIHLGLLPEGGLYQTAERAASRHRLTRCIWTGLTRPREENPEFPLPSFILAVGSAVAFVCWTLIVIYTPWLEPFNLATMGFFQTLRYPLLDPLFLTITLSGDALLLGAGFILFAGVLFRGGFRAAAVHVLAAGVAVTVLTTALKYGLYLGRPETVDLPPVTPAYPSGHSSGAAVLYGLMAAFVAQEFQHQRRWRVYATASIPILLVALSRLYLGVHWFTDTVGGLLLGLSICGAVRCSFSRYDRLKLPLGRPLVMTVSAWVILIAIYTAYNWQTALLDYAPVAP